MFGTKRDEWRGTKSRGKEEMLHPHPNIGLKMLEILNAIVLYFSNQRIYISAFI